MNSHYPRKACKQELKVALVANDQRSTLACLEDADETESLKKVHGGALGSKPEAITGIPPKVDTEQSVCTALPYTSAGNTLLKST